VVTTPKKGSHFAGFRQSVRHAGQEMEDGDSSYGSDDGIKTREGRNSVTKQPREERALRKADIGIEFRAEPEGPHNGFNLLFMLVNGLVVLFVSWLAYNKFKGDFCDSGIQEADGAANCSALRLSNGKECRACPSNAVCNQGKIVSNLIFSVFNAK
jgi:hypothetical protein